jgi:hypothetical protein
LDKIVHVCGRRRAWRRRAWRWRWSAAGCRCGTQKLLSGFDAAAHCRANSAAYERSISSIFRNIPFGVIELLRNQVAAHLDTTFLDGFFCTAHSDTSYSATFDVRQSASYSLPY